MTGRQYSPPASHPHRSGLPGGSSSPARTEVRRIADARAPWCVTVYGDAGAWLRGNHPTEQARTQIRDVLRALADAGAPTSTTDAIRGQLERLASDTADRVRMDERIRSVGIFATPEECESIPLITSPAPWVGVGDRFLIAPLVEGMLAVQPPVFALAASENSIRLVDVTAHPPRVVDVPGLPESLRTTVRLDLTGDRDTLAHLRTSEDPKERLREYARAIHRAIGPVLHEAGALLLIAAAEPLSSILQDTLPNSASLAGTLPGNHDDDTPDRLGDLADSRVGEVRARRRESQLDRLTEASPSLVLYELDAIERASRAGAIDTLFIDTDWRAPAADAPPAGGLPDRHDELVRQALADDAIIVPVHPGPPDGTGPAAALLRYVTDF
ncbi:baeRF11 domain-containing protein [Microbacterium sp. BR1]|uniref:baeRF11 domain-containing protein n=1 Tax=Microbacterium sp. BR1 TaxID=1070896 RepID=UPI0018E250FE|nr:hypothetical protein [Microbacterium sp. BR1]